MTSTGPEQVTIDVERLTDQLDPNKQMGSLMAGEIAIDGRRSRGHNRHGSNGSHHSHHHHSNHSHSGESDGEQREQNRNRRSSRRRSRSRSRSPSRGKRSTDNSVPPTEKDVATNSHDVEPLLITDVHHTKKHTELDEEDSDDSVTQHEENPGVDDGFFVGTRAETDETYDKFNTNVNHNNIPHDNPPFPYVPGFNPNVILDANGNPQVLPDINVYQQKKNLAQGMMDLALLSANANQLRYVVETYARHPYYWFSLISISISLILQVAVGVGLILNSRYNVKNKEQICRADKINNFTIIGIFLITTVNVFITAFGVAPTESKPN